MNRLRWRCQRGMLELDHILGRFLDTANAGAKPAGRRAFEVMLAMEDADLLDLIMDRAQAPKPEFVEVLALLRRQG